METRRSSHQADPPEVATAHVADPSSSISSPNSTQEVTIAPIEAVNGPLTVDAQVEEADTKKIFQFFHLTIYNGMM